MDVLEELVSTVAVWSIAILAWLPARPTAVRTITSVRANGVELGVETFGRDDVHSYYCRRTHDVVAA
jgi:hypothetical protein